MRIAEFVSLYFSLTAVGLSIIAYEKDYYNLRANHPDSHEDVVIVTILMWVAFAFNLLLFASIILRHNIYFKWLHSKKLVTQYDTLQNTGQWKVIVKEIIVCLIMPFPFINTVNYTEIFYQKEGDPLKIQFRWNYILLSFMTFARVYQVIKCALMVTYWLSPRA